MSLFTSYMFKSLSLLYGYLFVVQYDKNSAEQDVTEVVQVTKMSHFLVVQKPL